MKLLLAVPSKNRIETLLRYTYGWIKYSQLGDLKIFVEPQDYDNYVEYIPAHHLVIIPENNKGLGYVKSQIKTFAVQNNYDYIFKLDDDIRCFMDFRHSFKDSGEKIKFFDKTVPYLLSVMEQSDKLKCVCFPYSFELYERRKWSRTKRVNTAYICKTDFLFADPNVSTFEDFATGIYILANNGAILKYGLTAIELGVEVGGGSGGLQDFDRSIQAQNEVEILRKLYPPLKFKKVDKPWKIEPDIRSIKI